MNRARFMAILTSELKNIEPAELQDLLQYYQEFFDDAGKEREQEVIADLGSPYEIAKAIRDSSEIRRLESGHAGTKDSFRAVWLTIGAIFAAPIALPLALSLAALGVTVVLVYILLIATVFIVGTALALSGLLLAFCSAVALPFSFPTFMMMLGSGLFAGGLGVLIWVPTLWLTRSSFRWLALFINRKILRKAAAKNEME